jgi:deoxyribonuclease-4
MIKFGVAGFPPVFERTARSKERVSVFEWLHNLGLHSIELQMTYGPRTRPETCKEYYRAAQEFGISISVHASYFIVFTSSDEEKVQRSRDTLMRTYELCDLLGAEVVVLHPGSTYAGDEVEVLDRCTDNIGSFLNWMGSTNVGLFVETAGKIGQLGSVSQILEISERLPGVHPCIDFGHVHARTLGNLDNEKSIQDLVRRIISYCSVDPDNRVHFHYTPIHYGLRGEIQHRAIHDRYPKAELADADPHHSTNSSELLEDQYYHPRYEPVAKALKLLNVDCTIISETRNTQEEGALALMRAYHDADDNKF